MSLIARIIAEDAIAMEQLRAARELGLPDWCIAAGFVRNRVWDHLHGIVPPRLPADIDVIYYDAGDVSQESEAGVRATPRRAAARPALAGPQPGAHARLEGPAAAPRHRRFDDLLAGDRDRHRRAPRSRRHAHRHRAARHRRSPEPALPADRVRPHAAPRIRCERGRQAKALARALAARSCFSTRRSNSFICRASRLASTRAVRADSGTEKRMVSSR